MSGTNPGGDPRFGGVPGSGDPQQVPPSTFAPTSTAPSAAPAAQPGAGGFVLAPAATTAGPRRRLGPPKWFWPTVLGAVTALVLLGAAIYYVQGQNTKADQAVFKHTTLAVPESVAGLAQGTGPGVASAQQRALLSLGQSQALQGVSGSYLDADGNSYALVAAGKHVTKPAELSSTADATARHFGSGLASGGDAAPIALSDQTAGPLGGVMRCGTAKVSGVPVTLCVAVDEGSILEAVVATTDVNAAANTARALRQAVVTRTS